MREFLSACYDYLGTLAILAKEIESLHAQVAELRAENAELNQILANVERHLDGVKYSGTYDVGVAELKAENERLKVQKSEFSICIKRFREIASERDEIKRQFAALKALFVVNMIRAFPQMSHEQVKAEIDAVMREVAE